MASRLNDRATIDEQNKLEFESFNLVQTIYAV